MGLGAGEYVAFADLRLDLLRRGARFRALDFDGQQVLVGPVFVGAQLKGETSVGVRGLRFLDLDVLVATVHVPEGGVQGFHRGVGEADINLVPAVAQVAVVAVDQQFVLARLDRGAGAHISAFAFATVVEHGHHLPVDGFLVQAIQRREFPDQHLRRGLLERLAAQVLQHRAFQAATGEGDVEDVGADVLLQETGKVVVLAAVAGAHQGDLRVAGIAEQVAVRRFALGLGAELFHVLDRVAGAAELAGHVVQGAGLAHAPRDLGLEFTVGNVGKARHLFHRLGDDLRGALGAVRGPVLVATEVEIVGLLFVGQRRQVRHVVAHLGEAPEHRLVVAQGFFIVELGALGREQFVAIHQATGRLVDHYQLHALALEGIVQLLQAPIAGGAGVELGAQVFLGAEQPVALGLDQGGEVLLVAADVVLRVMGRRAQAAAGLGGKARRLDFLGLEAAAGGKERRGETGQAEQFDQVWVHKGRPQSRKGVWRSTGSISTAFCWRTSRSRISSWRSPRIPVKLMPLFFVGASMETRYNSTLNGESMDSGPLPLPASSPPTTISETWASNGSSLMSRSVSLRSLMWP